jgi:hypothetical protein
MFLVSVVRPLRRADNLTAIFELIIQCGVLNISQPYWPLTGKASLFYFYIIFL